MNTKKSSHLSIFLTVSMLAIAVIGSTSASAQNQPQTNRADTAETLPAADATNLEPINISAAPVPNPPALPPPPGTWTGWYVGGHLGYGWGKADTTFTPLPSAAQFINLAPTTLRPDPRGIVGGAQIGYNKQVGVWVFGPEFTISASNMNGTATVTPIIQNNSTTFNGTLTARQDTDWISTLRWRVGGLPTPNRRLLLYLAGGWAVGRVNYSANSDFRPQGTTQYPASITKNKNGWTIGGGAEVAVSPHVSVKGEYLYYDLGTQSITANPTPANPPFQVSYTWQTKAHVVVGGVNFHF